MVRNNSWSQVVILVVAVLALCAMCALPALAQPTLFGPTGLLRTPNADVLQPTGMEFGLNWDNSHATVAAMTAGVIRNVEISPAYVWPTGGENATIISGKWHVWDETAKRPAVAVGLFDVGDQYNRSLYGVAQKDFNVGETPVQVSAGWGEHRSLVDGFFAGASLSLGRGYTALVEYDGNDVNAGLRWPCGRHFTATVGSVSNDLYLAAAYQLR